MTGDGRGSEAAGDPIAGGWRSTTDDPRAGIERRATVRLRRYWASLRRVGTMPLFRDFDPHRNPVPWETCFLARREGGAAAPIFDHIGSALWVALDRPAPVVGSAARLPEFLEALIAQMTGVLATGEPA